MDHEHFVIMKRDNSPTANQPLRKLFLLELADMHSSETQLSKALILITKAARSKDLKALLKMHQRETAGHAATIEEIAESLEVKLPRKTCHAMRGILKEAVAGLLSNLTSSTRDAALIAAGRKIEHYEIASYGTLSRWAKELGYTHELAQLLSILTQEKLADALLARLAEGAGPLEELVKEVSAERILTA
jgi:ferritin-like metal-binding protein YciE